MKIVSPAKNCYQVDTLDGRRHSARDGIFDVSDSHAKQILKIGGALPNQLGATHTGLGYRCRCGHGSFFKTCGRCGAECVREES
jgi:hypothetical protein